MPALPIRIFPDPVLRKSANPVAPGEGIQDFIGRLLETLYAQPSGIGIAAPQVNDSRRIIVVDVSSREASKKCQVMMNPVIVRREGEVISREGCMSLPDYTANLKRYGWIRVKWQDELGKPHEKVATGIEAICIQHEVDHLNGKLILDRAACLKTDVLPRRRRA